MAQFPAGGNPYKRFADFVRFTSRHVLDETNQHFLRVVVETSQSRKRRMKTGTRLWRAQIDCVPCKRPLTDESGKNIGSFNHVSPFAPERMKPLADRAYEGRVNAKGIPCLYLSDDMKTAMTEVRPWIGSYISVGEFEIGRDLVLVDCSADHGLPLLSTPEGTPAERERLEWWAINYAFSTPVTRSDDTADYAPTQVIAEAFRQDGCDGLIYGSRLGTGRNVAIFDLTAAELLNRRLYQVEKVEFTFADRTWEDDDR